MEAENKIFKTLHPLVQILSIFKKEYFIFAS